MFEMRVAGRREGGAVVGRGVEAPRLAGWAAVAAVLLGAFGLSAPANAALPSGDPKITGKLVRELPQLRTRTSNTYVDERGRYAARVSAESVNFEQADGSWLPIDPTLVPAGTGFATKAAGYRAELPRTLLTPVKVSEGGQWVSFKLEGAGAASKVSIAGTKATYTSVLGGVSAVYNAGNDTLKEDLVLASKTATRSFSYTLDASAGLTPKLRSSGIVEFDDSSGRTFFTLGAPVVIDAAGNESRAVSHGLVQSTRGVFKLTTTVDAAWLNAADRKFPVRVDPGASPIGDPDCSLSEAAADTSGCYTDSLKVGRQSGKEHRAVMRFAIADALPRDAEVFNASLAMYLRSQTAPTLSPTQVVVSRATHSWTSGASWNRYDGTNRWGAPGGDFADAPINGEYDSAGGTSGALRAYYFNIGQTISDWHTSKVPNYGLVVREEDSSKDNLLTFDSTETTSGEDPYLVISYQRRLGERPGYKLEDFPLNDRMSLKVNSATGNLLLRQTDMTVPGGLGPDTTVGRTYNLFQPGPDTPAYATGWTMDTGAGVFLENQGNYFQQLYGPSGWGMQFTPKTGSNIDYDTPPGIAGKLTKDTGSGQHTLTLDKSQTKYVFEGVSAGQRARLLRIEDRNGRKVSFTYVGTTVKLSKIVDNQDRETLFVYDSSNRVTKMTDPAGRDHLYDYAAGTGFLSSYTNPAGGITYYFYDTTGRLTKVTTPGGRSTTVTYYPVGHADAGKVKSVTRVTNVPASGDGPTTKFVYDAHRDTSSDSYVTDPLDHETRYSFDTSSRVTNVVDALGNKQATTYDLRSNVETYSAPGSTTGSANLSRNSFDTDGNLTGTSTPTTGTAVSSGGKAIRSSASFGTTGATGAKFLPSSSTDAQGKSTSYSYNAAGNPTQITQQGNAAASVKFEYSPTVPGQVDATRDGLDKATGYLYDAKGNLTKITPPSASIGVTQISYGGHSGADQALSRVSSVTRPTAATETYDYDALDRVTKVTYSDGKEVQSTYDADGNLTQAVDTATGAGTRTLTYDALNRLLTQVGPNSATYTYRYDASSNLTSVQDNNGTTEYGYDAANRGVSVYEPGVATPVKYTLDDRGNRIKTTLPNGVVTEQNFNEASQLLRTCTRPASSTTACSSSTASRLLDFVYTYRERTGAQGEGMNVDELQATVTDKDDKLTVNCYDDLNRVTRVETGTTTTPPAACTAGTPAAGSSDWFTYALDAAGNITGSQRKGQTQKSFAYADGNRLCWSYTGASSNLCGNVPAGATTYSYDAAGQETAVSGTRTSAYNVRQQLTSVIGGGTTTNITAFGTGQDDLMTAAGNTHRSGVLGLSQIGSDTYVRDEGGALVSQLVSSSRKYVHTDSLGSVRALTDSSGAVSTRLDYDPYGTPTSTSTPSATTSRFGYAQGELIGAGLYHYGQRYYDPAIMRWTQPDPLLNASDVRQANRYAYVGGDPVNLTDPSGQYFAEKVIRRYTRAGERFIFSDKLRRRAEFGGKLIRATSAVTIGLFAHNCANRLTGGGLEGTNPGNCSPTQLVPIIGPAIQSDEAG